MGPGAVAEPQPGRLRADPLRFGVAVGGAQGGRPCRKSDGGEGKNMGGEPRRTFSPAEKEGGEACFFVRERVADGLSAERRSGGVFPRAQRDFFVGNRPRAGWRPELSDGSARRCLFRTHAPVLPLEQSLVPFPRKSRQIRTRRTGQSCGRPAGQEKEKDE